MKHSFLATLLLAVVPLAHAQSTYTDPDGRYSLQVPPGWRVEPQGGGVSLLKGPAYASLMKVGGRGAPKGLVEALGQKFPSQWQRFTGTSAGEVQFGGRPGAYAWFTGVDPRGTEAVLKIVATVEGETGYAMMSAAPRSDFPAYKADLEKIEAGFRLTGARR
ncbi:hypothetical protein [Variovorax saccharolyticus]|uniref:hypothetical protein n=1 Tax=Variovorax saccharolyticus TaxID=3053516 RepID=UPI002576DFA2|nr:MULTISPECIES: hypothetical protein [unclassified Variovorax]MDM0021096.1 hypothetical protein [Variovorax sp. J22R187]MDM0025442.1 hypothetical protein [Variovorax sp. J31P216]